MRFSIASFCFFCAGLLLAQPKFDKQLFFHLGSNFNSQNTITFKNKTSTTFTLGGNASFHTKSKIYQPGLGISGGLMFYNSTIKNHFSTTEFVFTQTVKTTFYHTNILFTNQFKLNSNYTVDINMGINFLGTTGYTVTNHLSGNSITSASSYGSVTSIFTENIDLLISPNVQFQIEKKIGKKLSAYLHADFLIKNNKDWYTFYNSADNNGNKSFEKSSLPYNFNSFSIGLKYNYGM